MMDCVHSTAPDDEELLRYALDDEPLEAKAKEHLEQCDICQQRLTTYKRTNAFLLSQLYRSQCPGAMQLTYYCAHLLSADEAMGIADHLKLCPLCAAEVRDVRHSLASYGPLLEPAPSLLSHPIVKRIIATLVPWQPQLVTRGGLDDAQRRGEWGSVDGPSWPRQYRAEAINISLHLSRASEGEDMLLGLFSSVDPKKSVDDLEGIMVDLYRAPGPASGVQVSEEPPLMYTHIDDLGNVVFKNVPMGDYVMIVRMPDAELVIEGLTIEHG